MSVSSTREEYEIQLVDVTRNRDAVAGERRVKHKRTEYLPPTPSMCITTIDAQNGYQQIVGRTVDGLSGLIFSDEPQKELATSVEYLDDNVDGKGNSLRKQSQKAVEEAFVSPRSGLLVDFPSVAQHVSVAEAEASNLRPKILHYPYESIRNWFYEVVDNQLKLSLVVLSEMVEQLGDDYKVKKVEQFRVLRLIDGVYHVGLYNSNDEPVEELTPVLVDGAPSSEIPFYFIEVGAEGKSVINDLVDANFNHYRFFADYAIKEHASAFPVFWETGSVDEDRNMAIGPGAKWSNPSSDANFGVIQSSSDGGSMRTYLLDMETRMAALGAEMLKPRSAGVESAESKALDKVAQDSTTANVAVNVSEAYEKALHFAARWLGSDDESVYRLSTDYSPGNMTGQELTALVGAWQSGAISYDTMYANLQKAELASPERSAEEEQGLIVNSELGLAGGV
jgi:hypothetical protein